LTGNSVSRLWQVPARQIWSAAQAGIQQTPPMQSPEPPVPGAAIMHSKSTGKEYWKLPDGTLQEVK